MLSLLCWSCSTHTLQHLTMSMWRQLLQQSPRGTTLSCGSCSRAALTLTCHSSPTALLRSSLRTFGRTAHCRFVLAWLAWALDLCSAVRSAHSISNPCERKLQFLAAVAGWEAAQQQAAAAPGQLNFFAGVSALWCALGAPPVFFLGWCYAVLQLLCMRSASSTGMLVICML